MGEEELREALKAKGYDEEQVEMIMNPSSDPADPPEEDDPPEEVKVGPLIREREELEKDFEEGVRTKGERFIRRIKSPKRDPIKAGSSDKAEEQYAGKLNVAIEQKRRQVKLGHLTFEDDWAPEVAELRAEDWTRPTLRKKDKWGRRWTLLRDARIYAKSKLLEMPVETPEQRKDKMGANLEMMRHMKLLSIGLVNLADFRTKVDELARVR